MARKASRRTNMHAPEIISLANARFSSNQSGANFRPNPQRSHTSLIPGKRLAAPHDTLPSSSSSRGPTAPTSGSISNTSSMAASAPGANTASGFRNKYALAAPHRASHARTPALHPRAKPPLIPGTISSTRPSVSAAAHVASAVNTAALDPPWSTTTTASSWAKALFTASAKDEPAL
jgi:hypothetical protein